MKSIRERFEAKISYEPMSGCWLWTGFINWNGYGQFHINRRTGTSHKVGWELVHGQVPEGFDLDHICHNRACVNPDHLRLATRSENLSNAGKSKQNKSGFKGVYLESWTGRWRAQISLNNKSINLGRFKTPEEAHSAYCRAAKALFGKFANYGETL
jgi:hypothetical protein